MRLLILVPVIALAAGAQPPVVATLHTVSIHVDSVETYNTLFQLWSGAFKWPVLYGKPLTAEQEDRRNCAGIWAGNIRLELCGPYPGEFEPQDARARLHGLTFRPHETLESSAAELVRRAIRHRPLGTRFIIFDDPDMNAPLLRISIMQVSVRQGVTPDHESGQPKLVENRGGPLGLKHAREFRITYPDSAALRKWRRLLDIEGESWSGAGGAALRFLKGVQGGIATTVLEVESVEKAARVLRDLGLPAVRTKEGVECHAHGVRLLLSEETGGR